MAELPPEEMMDVDAILAEVRREFSSGLPDRLETMRSALVALGQGFEAESAEVFYRSAHSLKGTAQSFDGPELATHAAPLADAGHRWLKLGAVTPDEVAAARQELERLRSAIERYRARVERGDSK